MLANKDSDLTYNYLIIVLEMLPILNNSFFLVIFNTDSLISITVDTSLNGPSQPYCSPTYPVSATILSWDWRTLSGVG